MLICTKTINYGLLSLSTFGVGYYIVNNVTPDDKKIIIPVKLGTGFVLLGCSLAFMGVFLKNCGDHGFPANLLLGMIPCPLRAAVEVST